MSKGYIYVIKPHNLKVDGRPVVKIGRTTRSPSKRLRQLVTALPSGASLSYVAQFPDVRWAESYLHQALAKYRVTKGGGTEFFSLSVTQAITVVQTLAHKVSEVEAKAALERELDSYLDKLAGAMLDRMVKWMFFGAWALSTLWVYMELVGSGSLSLSLLALSAFFGLVSAIFLTMLGNALGHKLAALYFRKELASARARLLSKYPAARGRGGTAPQTA